MAADDDGMAFGLGAAGTLRTLGQRPRLGGGADQLASLAQRRLAADPQGLRIGAIDPSQRQVAAAAPDRPRQDIDELLGAIALALEPRAGRFEAHRRARIGEPEDVGGTEAGRRLAPGTGDGKAAPLRG